MEKRLKISEIEVGHRHRKSFGDLQGLAHSIKEVGLLQAIGVTKSGSKLVFGERRLRATKLNGDDSIDCRILDIDDILKAEHAENEFRETLTLTEKAALADELERQMKGVERRGNPTGNNQHVRKHAQSGRNSKRGETREHVAVKAGFNTRSEMSRVKTVMDRGAPELIEAMDKGKIAISAAAEIAKSKTKAEQVKVLESHSTNGHVHVPKKSQAVLFRERMEEVTERVHGIEKQFGSAEKMMESSLWATSTKTEKRKCVNAVVACSQELAGLAKDLEKYASKSLI